MRGKLLLLGLLAVGVVVLGVGSASADLPSNCSQSGATVTCTFSYTGSAQTWTVPAGVTSATFDLYGAQGYGFGDPFAGGLGGETTATLAVTPAASVEVNVGGAGGIGDASASGAGG